MRGTLTRIAQEFGRRPAQDSELQLLPLDAQTDGIAFSEHALPRISIIIPVHGKLAYTVTCLRSLTLHMGSTSAEVIVVDDASPDATASALASIDGLRLVVNERNLGFVGSCNAGAQMARGDYLVFLNNDTQVTDGWLDTLMRCFAEEPDCGIAGSRLVYPDGRLQEAGGWVFNDGSAWNVGRFESRNASAYRYRRRTDYLSGAAIMIRRECFFEVGGFDQRYAPAYYEDTDLAFAVRRAGLSVFYEPNSVVVHCEGISAGTDLNSGMKQYQTINRSAFVAKWRDQLQHQPAPGTPLQQLWQRHARGHILVVDAMTPDPSRDSGSLRLFAMLRILHQEGWRLSFAPDDGYADDASISALGALGVQVLCRPEIDNLPKWLDQNGLMLHAVVLCRHTVAGQYVHAVRRYAPQAKLILDTVDLHFVREQRAADLDRNTSLRRQAETSRRSELALIKQCDTSFVVSPQEKELLHRLLPQAHVELLSNIHDVYGRGRAYTGRNDLVFIGGYGHPPNADAIQWIADTLLPMLRTAMPDVRVHVLGDLPDTVRKALQRPGLELHGRVRDLSPWLDSCLASLAPLRFGAGVKGKINMAMSHGLPVIATDIAIEGMQLQDGRDVLLANTPDETVQAVQRLRADENLWIRLSDAGLENVHRHFSPAAARETLRKVMG
ncbi:glycosyltransferase [Dyella psychrodurans]|uniref:Glycosyltransferase n=1 Tax=Dyella psychrodurans TaxID=1927960 RepID=A0A370X4V8_9GAMM|nr:glycosyltransferase [Dyella psychrodurans]RDS83428.1 glycosyltransferase [Dyella psychrodurans]